MVDLIAARGRVDFQRLHQASSNPPGLMAGIAVMIAVSALACRYALLCLATGRDATAVMTI
jgi:hypothetical protein